MPEQKGNFIYRLLIINTLEHIHHVDTLVKGLIMSTFGILLSLLFMLVFRYIEWGISAEIAKLSMIAYGAIFLFHFVKYWQDRVKERAGFRFLAGEARVVVGLLATLFILLSLFDQALLIARVFPAAGEFYTTFWVFLHALPGLIVLMLPLFAWEPLSDVTPVDDIVRWWFK